jgi:hypothetical protein
MENNCYSPLILGRSSPDSNVFNNQVELVVDDLSSEKED